MTPFLGMSIAELVGHINRERATLNKSAITLQTRPSYSAPGKTTIEVVNGAGQVLTKSISGGAISFYLKGMLQMLHEEPLPKVSGKINPMDFKRVIKWKD